jgi:hypothetical protein
MEGGMSMHSLALDSSLGEVSGVYPVSGCDAGR